MLDKKSIFTDILKEFYKKGEEQEDITVKELIDDMTEKLKITFVENK